MFLGLYKIEVIYLEYKSLKAKIDRLLKKSFDKSKKTKSKGVKGFYNVSAGYRFEKYFDEYLLVWDYGNMVYRNASNEEHNSKTKQMYDYLVEHGLGDILEIIEYRNRIAILIKKHFN